MVPLRIYWSNGMSTLEITIGLFLVSLAVLLVLIQLYRVGMSPLIVAAIALFYTAIALTAAGGQPACYSGYM